LKVRNNMSGSGSSAAGGASLSPSLSILGFASQPASAPHAAAHLSPLKNGESASTYGSPRGAGGAPRVLPRNNAGAAAFHATAAALAALSPPAALAGGGDEEGAAEGNNIEIDIDNLDKYRDDAFAVFVKESDFEFLDLFNNDYTTYEQGGAGAGGAGAGGAT
jgi:hypothetical protein